MKRCEICRGDKVIKLMRYSGLSIVPNPAIPTTQEANYRIYPCPECAVTVPENQVKLVRHYEMEIFPSELRIEPGHREILLRSSSRALADRLLREGFIDFDYRTHRNADQPHYMDAQFTASISVATRAHVASMAEREAEAQRAVARPLQDAIHKLIDGWSIREDRIHKSQAKDCVDGGIKYVMENLPFSLFDVRR